MAENEENKFGDFKEVSEDKGEAEVVEPGQEAPIRVRVPKGNEVLGKVEQRTGGNRTIISCFDGKQRNCRVPGRLKRRLWIRQGNIVLIQPWEFDGDKRGDIIYTYKPTAVKWLEKHGYLKGVEEEF